MYVIDLKALQEVRVDYGAPPGAQVFRLPDAEEWAQPRRSISPFDAVLPRPNVVYVRVGPVG